MDHVSDINLCYTENSKNYLIHEGFTKDNVFVVGSPVPEVIEYYNEKINKSIILEHLSGKYQTTFENKKYFLVSIHREENLDLENNLLSIINSIKKIQELYKYPVIFSTHPRTKKKLTELNINMDDNKNIYFSEPFGFLDYVNLIKNSYCFISDSGTISEEVAWLKVPGVTIRNSIERPEAVENGNIIVTGLETDNIITSINFAIESNNTTKSIPYDYNVLDSSDRVIKTILSYYHMVNKKTWFKN